MKKKIFVILLSFTLVLSMTACGSPKVSGTVDREPITSTDAKTSEEGTVEGEGASTKESSALENSSALADWYNSNDRKKLEDTLNQMYVDSGITFSISIAEPDMMIWTYQYDEPISDESNREALYNYFYSSMDSQYQSYVEMIKNLKDDGIPVTTIRFSYLDADGTDLCTIDFTEDYIPSTDSTSPSQE